MPSSADLARDAVGETIVALERSCLDAESALIERRWTDVHGAFAAQAALTDELRTTFAQEPATAPANDPKVARRLHGILVYREAQMQRLHAYRDALQTRLRAIGKVRALARTIGTAERSGALYDTQR